MTPVQRLRFWQQTIEYVYVPLWVCVLFLFVLGSYAAGNVVWKVWAVGALRVPVLKTSAYRSASPILHLLNQIPFPPSLSLSWSAQPLPRRSIDLGSPVDIVVCLSVESRNRSLHTFITGNIILHCCLHYGRRWSFSVWKWLWDHIRRYINVYIYI